MVLQMHEGAFGLALQQGGGRAYGYSGRPGDTAALERMLFEPWARRFLDLSATEAFAHQAEADRKRRDQGLGTFERPPWRRV